MAMPAPDRTRQSHAKNAPVSNDARSLRKRWVDRSLRGRRPNDEEIEIWNAFLAKRGWRDAGSADLHAAKERFGWRDRDDIQTWSDLHDVDKGRTPGRHPAG